MASKTNYSEPAEVLIFFAKVKGGGSVVAESVDRLAFALQHASQPRPVKAIVKTLPPPPKGEEKTLWDPAGEAGMAIDEEAEADVVDGAESREGARPPVTKRVRIPKGIPDLDFGSETPTFRDFVAEKKPKDQYDWYLLVASYLKQHKKIQEISLAHVVTAWQYVGASEWPLSQDPGAVFRDARRAKLGLFIKGSKDGLNIITKNGEERVRRMGKTD